MSGEQARPGGLSSLVVEVAGTDSARRLLAQHQLDRLLVVEQGDRLVGILSEADLRRDGGPLA